MYTHTQHRHTVTNRSKIQNGFSVKKREMEIFVLLINSSSEFRAEYIQVAGDAFEMRKTPFETSVRLT